jgi:hypothetical protein
VRLVLDETLGLQHPQRLAHRQSAGAEVVGDLRLAHALTGLDLAGKDGAAQVGGHTLARRRR